jgi:hypothetical protein
VNYAQVARIENIRESQGLAPDALLRMYPKKRVIVKIPNKIEARELKE